MVPRRFGFLGSSFAASDIPNFLSDESIALVVVADPMFPVAAGGDIQIVELIEEGPPYFSVSTWLWFPVLYVVQGGAEYEGTFYCEVTPEHPLPPAVGSHTFAGPDGLIINSEPLEVIGCSRGVGCPSGTDSAYLLVPPGEGNRPFVLVEGWFIE